MSRWWCVVVAVAAVAIGCGGLYVLDPRGGGGGGAGSGGTDAGGSLCAIDAEDSAFCTMACSTCDECGGTIGGVAFCVASCTGSMQLARYACASEWQALMACTRGSGLFCGTCPFDVGPCAALYDKWAGCDEAYCVGPDVCALGEPCGPAHDDLPPSPPCSAEVTGTPPTVPLVCTAGACVAAMPPCSDGAGGTGGSP